MCYSYGGHGHYSRERVFRYVIIGSAQSGPPIRVVYPSSRGGSLSLRVAPRVLEGVLRQVG